jgi:hypothetical protein
MKTIGRKTIKTTASAPKTARARTAAPAGARRAPTQAEIAVRSYEIYLARGGADGHHVEDWLQAEAELLSS